MTLDNYPTVRPAQTLDFAKSRYLPPEVTFARATPGTNGSDGTYVGPTGITMSDKDTPRFTWQNGECQGLLIEPSRTNLIENSLVTSANGWQDLGTLTANNALAPDGTMTASTCLPASGAQQTITSPLRIVPAAGIYTFSAFVQPTSVFTHFKLGVVNYADTGNQSVIFDTTKTGIDGITPLGTNTSNYLGASMDKSYANGWVRLSLTVNFVGPDLNGVMQLSNANPSVGDGVNSFAVWHGQLEEGTFPTSLIPTAGSQATRAADSAEISSAVTGGAIISKPFGAAIGGSALNFGTAGGSPIERVDLYADWLPYQQTAALAGVDDGFWRFRVLGADFALPDFEFENSGTPGALVQVDWGDGSSVETLTTATHTFIDHAGYHDVGFRVVGGTWFNPKIDNNTANKDKIVAVGPMPLGMFTVGDNTFRQCINLVSVGNLAFLPASDIFQTFEDCTALTVVPLFDTSEVLDFREIFKDANSIIELPPFDTSSCTAMRESFRGMTSLQSFPYIDTSQVETLFGAWYGCSSLLSFPVLDFSAVDEAKKPFRSCSSLTSFPKLNMDYCKNFKEGWMNCSGLVDWPVGFFDTWSRSPTNECFNDTWAGCSALSATSVERILDSIATANQSAPTGSGSQLNITIDYDTSTGIPYGGTLNAGVITPTPASITTLKGKSRPWIIVLNGVTQ